MFLIINTQHFPFLFFALEERKSPRVPTRGLVETMVAGHSVRTVEAVSSSRNKSSL